MIAYGTHEVEEYIVKSEIIEDFNSDDIYRPWDILQPKDSLSESDAAFLYTYDGSKEKYVHLFHDKGSVGVFLKGFFGYNSNPNLPEFVLWLLSLFYGLRMWRGFYY
jgi:high-affinity iron transporter